jgi:hypothetical protein
MAEYPVRPPSKSPTPPKTLCLHTLSDCGVRCDWWGSHMPLPLKYASVPVQRSAFPYMRG